jgi:hypothetical protein
MVAGEALLAAGTAASTAVGGIVSGLAADGDPTNEIRAVGQALTADRDPFNEVRTGSNVVYQLVENGATRYIGITKNFARRAYQHMSTHGWDIRPVEGLDHLSRWDARAAEQVLIEHYGLANLYNKINSIGVSNPIWGQAIQRGEEILSGLGFYEY